MFEFLFQQKPNINEQNIYCFSPDDTGDYFDEEDVASWRSGRLGQNWRNTTFLKNPVSRHLIEELIKNHSHVIDLACGPGMGLIPSIKQLVPDFPCLATDANPLVLQEWAHYLKSNSITCPPKLAQFSALQLPFHSGSVEAFSSFIGISSTHHNNVGYNRALSEVHRTLKYDGCFYTIESEWTNVPTILKLFKKMGREPWHCFQEEQVSWHDRFVNDGFEILYEKPYLFRKLREDDNELGKAASRFGVDIGLQFTAFIARKNKD